MLLATTDTRLGTARMYTTLAFERGVRGTIVCRDHLAYDTRFAAAAAGRLEPVGHVFLVVSGRFLPADGVPTDAPIGCVLADDEIERVGPKSRTFRTDGDRVEIVHLRFAREELVAPIGLANGPLVLPSAVWDAARGVVADPATLPAVVDALVAAHVTKGSVTFERDEPERYRRLWNAVRPLYQTHGGSISLKQLATTLDLSMRQVGRDAKDLATTFGFGTGYRDAFLMGRLRSAVMFLSAPNVTIADVAKTVGYGSTNAMARAFRDARLPAPGAIQAAFQ